MHADVVLWLLAVPRGGTMLKPIFQNSEGIQDAIRWLITPSHILVAVALTACAALLILSAAHVGTNKPDRKRDRGGCL